LGGRWHLRAVYLRGCRRFSRHGISRVRTWAYEQSSFTVQQRPHRGRNINRRYGRDEIKMARIRMPCMSVEAHGTLAGFLCFSTNRWGQYVKIIGKPRYTLTEGQKKVRHAYGQIAQLWRSRTPEEKKAYHPQAVKQGVTDFIAFFKETWPDFYVLEYSTALGRAILDKNHLGFAGL